MTYYYFKNRFLQRRPLHRTFQEQVFLQYDSHKNIWDKAMAPREKNCEIKWSLEIEKLTQNFNEKQWVIVRKADATRQTMGPYSSREIFEFLQNGQIEKEDFIWKKTMSKWQIIQEQESFRGLFGHDETIFIGDTANILESVVEMRLPKLHRVGDQNASPELDDSVFIPLTPE